MSLDELFGTWAERDRLPREYRLSRVLDRLDTMSVIFDVRDRPSGPVRLGSGRRPKMGPPPKPTNKRAKVKAARKANQRRRKS